MAKRRYRSKVKIGVGPDGRDIVKYIQGRTRQELHEVREQVIIQYITGAPLTEDRLFGDYAAEWFRVKKAPFLAASGRESYRTALNKDLLPRLGDRMLRSISATDLQMILNGYADASATKITVVMATLRGIFRSALADRLIGVDPANGLLRPAAAPAHEKPALTPVQRSALEEVCRTHPQGHYLALMYYLGVRPGEARGLQWGDIDWKSGRVHIMRDIDYKNGGKAGALKTAASYRTVPLPKALRTILEPRKGFPHAYIAHGTDAGSPLAKTSAERLWLDLMRAAGLATPVSRSGYRHGDIRRDWQPLITPHALRHNYITLCWEHGLDPYETMKLVGHTSITTTMNIYTHLSEKQMTRTAEKLDAMFGGCNFNATHCPEKTNASTQKIL